jgi:predicted transcriptional regulator
MLRRKLAPGEIDMEKTVDITVRLSAGLHDRVDAIAHALDQPSSWVIERAIESFVEIEGIRQALAEADAGGFASDSEVEEVFAKWRARAQDAS